MLRAYKIQTMPNEVTQSTRKLLSVCVHPDDLYLCLCDHGRLCVYHRRLDRGHPSCLGREGVDHPGRGRMDQVRDRLGRSVWRIPEEVHHRHHGAIRLLVDRRDAHLLCDAGLHRPYLFGHLGGDDDDCDDEHRPFVYHLGHGAMAGLRGLGHLLELVLAWSNL